MTDEQLLLRTIDRHARQPKVGIEFLARETGLTPDVIRETLQRLTPEHVTLTALPGDGRTLYDVRAVRLTDHGRRGVYA